MVYAMVKILVDFLGSVKADKWLHFICGLLIAQVTGILLMFCLPKWLALLCGLAVACIAAAGKELWDKRHGVPSLTDFIASVVGAVIGLAVIAI